ncbi:MAG: hypothetical protein QOI10_3467 [Solirubrobacterales bacterium]|jgi:hypothetical protein|nr:hypothetical protein [Solirubrobacterales bacterium]
MDVQQAFDAFYDKIELRALSEERVGRAWGRLHAHLTKEYGLPAEAVFVQGSWANDTAIRPADADGEYDLDIIVVCAEPDADAATTIAELRDVLSRDADLAKRMLPDEEGRPCVRLGYAREPEGFGFHVDVTPARVTGREAPPLEVPMRGREGWRETDPAAYTNWCYGKGEDFKRTVRELKRWRDVHDASIKSIVLQVLVGYSIPERASNDAERIELTLKNIRGRFAAHTDRPPRIENPVLPTEDLADRWSPEDYRRFLVELDEAISLVSAARSASEADSYRRWQDVFGSDFPDAPVRRSPVVPPPPPPPQRKPEPERGRRYG